MHSMFQNAVLANTNSGLLGQNMFGHESQNLVDSNAISHIIYCAMFRDSWRSQTSCQIRNGNRMDVMSVCMPSCE